MRECVSESGRTLGPQVLEQALEAMETQMKMEREFHVVQLTRVHANTIERFENTVERREGWGLVRTRWIFFDFVKHSVYDKIIIK